MSEVPLQASLELHNKVATSFRKTAVNFHYEFSIRHLASVYTLNPQPSALHPTLHKNTQSKNPEPRAPSPAPHAHKQR